MKTIINTRLCVLVFLTILSSIKCLLPKFPDSAKCVELKLDSPYKKAFKLDKNGRVYIPFHLNTKKEFLLRLGTDLHKADNEDESPYYFIRIEGHNIYSGGKQNANGDEEILEAFTSIKSEVNSKGYFIRIHVRSKSTSIALYSGGNEEAEPLILFRDESSPHIRNINSLVMESSPGSAILVDCKSELHQLCSFSTDCVVPGSICRELDDQKISQCICSDTHKENRDSSCTAIHIKLGDECIDSRKCHAINAKCRRDYVNDTDEKTCQCYKGQIVTDNGHCNDSPGKINWARLSRSYPTYEELYPGKLPPLKKKDEYIKTYKDGPCLLDLELNNNSERSVSIPYKQYGFDIKFILHQKIDGTIKFSIKSLRNRIVASISLSNRGPDVLKFAKSFKYISNYSGLAENSIFFRVENDRGKSMFGFNDGVSTHNISVTKISNVMNLPTDLGITSDFPASIRLFCE